MSVLMVAAGPAAGVGGGGVSELFFKEEYMYGGWVQ